jgi:uncharacterized cupin superfamily protein
VPGGGGTQAGLPLTAAAPLGRVRLVAEDGWFKENLAHVQGYEHPTAGKVYMFGESGPYERYRDVGINIRVLEPRQPASPYHSEGVEEFFIVLGGECMAVVEDEEVPLLKWDFLMCPPGTAHVIVGAGAGPATVLMVSGRRGEGPPHYPVSEAAARYGASVKTATDDPRQAFGQLGWERRLDPTPLPWPPE